MTSVSMALRDVLSLLPVTGGASGRATRGAGPAAAANARTPARGRDTDALRVAASAAAASSPLLALPLPPALPLLPSRAELSPTALGLPSSPDADEEDDEDELDPPPPPAGPPLPPYLPPLPRPPTTDVGAETAGPPDAPLLMFPGAEPSSPGSVDDFSPQNDPSAAEPIDPAGVWAHVRSPGLPAPRTSPGFPLLPMDGGVPLMAAALIAAAAAAATAVAVAEPAAGAPARWALDFRADAAPVTAGSAVTRRRWLLMGWPGESASDLLFARNTDDDSAPALPLPVSSPV